MRGVMQRLRVGAVAQLRNEKSAAEAHAAEMKGALEEAYDYIEQLEEERCGRRGGKE